MGCSLSVVELCKVWLTHILLLFLFRIFQMIHETAASVCQASLFILCTHKLHSKKRFFSSCATSTYYCSQLLGVFVIVCEICFYTVYFSDSLTDPSLSFVLCHTLWLVFSRSYFFPPHLCDSFFPSYISLSACAPACSSIYECLCCSVREWWTFQTQRWANFPHTSHCFRLTQLSLNSS